MVNIKRGDFLGVLYLDSRRPLPSPSSTARFWTPWLPMPPASSIMPGSSKRARTPAPGGTINIARNIQQALLLAISANSRILPLMVTICLSLRRRGLLRRLPISEGRTAFLIADVSGKGLGAALLTTMLQGALSAMTLGTDPARVFNHINRFLCGHAEVGRYATMFFGILDEDGHLEFINAGHPSPFLIRNGVAEEAFTEGSFPVGLVPEAEYTASVSSLSPVTRSYFSVTASRKPWTPMTAVRCPAPQASSYRPAECPLEQIQKCVLESVENFARGAHQADDLTLLVVRYRAIAASATPTPMPLRLLCFCFSLRLFRLRLAAARSRFLFLSTTPFASAARLRRLETRPSTCEQNIFPEWKIRSWVRPNARLKEIRRENFFLGVLAHSRFLS